MSSRRTLGACVHATRRIVCLLVAVAAVSGCAADRQANMGQAPEYGPQTPVSQKLKKLPVPAQPVSVGVYDFPDMTGQRKPNDKFAEYSRAVTQGGRAYLVNALTTAADGQWFNVVERTGLDSLLQERRLIRGTRDQYQGNNGSLPPMHFAGVMLEGGVISYNANTLTGGFGAKFLGIGGNTEYRQDMVTVACRVVSVRTGEVLASVTTTKTIYSVLAEASVFRFVSVDELLEVETGVTQNEPPQLAVRQAIQLAVYSLVLEGAVKGLWEFKNPDAATELIDKYEQIRKSPESAPDLIEDGVAAAGASQQARDDGSGSEDYGNNPSPTLASGPQAQG